MATQASKDRTQTFTLRPGEIAEVVERRTRGAKVFELAPSPDGARRFRIGAGIGPIHYRPDPFDATQALEDIDLDVRLTPGQGWDAACETNGYQVRFWQSRIINGRTVRYIAQFRRAGHWMGMAPVALAWENDAGERQLVGRPQAVGAAAIDNDANTVTWANAFGPGLSWRYNLRPDEFFKTVIIRQKSDLPTPTIGTAGLRLSIVVALSWGDIGPANGFASSRAAGEDYGSDLAEVDAPEEALADPEAFSMRDVLAREICWLRRPRAWDSSERQQTAGMDWRLVRKAGRVYGAISIPAAMLNAGQTKYPVFLDTTIAEEAVGASSDDCTGIPSQSTMNLDAVNINCGDWDASYYDYDAGMRFTTVPIPQGAIIDSATVSVRAYFAYGTGWLSKIRGQNADHAATFSTYADFAGRPRTSEGVDWDPAAWIAGTWYVSPDIAAIVQEIVSRPGWASNNAVAFFWKDDQGAGYQAQKFFGATSYDGSYPPKFNCTYSMPKAGSDAGSGAEAATVVRTAILTANSPLTFNFPWPPQQQSTNFGPAPDEMDVCTQVIFRALWTEVGTGEEITPWVELRNTQNLDTSYDDQHHDGNDAVPWQGWWEWKIEGSWTKAQIDALLLTCLITAAYSAYFFEYYDITAEITYTAVIGRGVSDAGAGVDGVPAISGAVGIAETGEGADAAPSVRGAVGVSEAGSGADTPALVGAVPIPDSGLGTDATPAVLAAVPIGDAGAGADVIAGPLAGIPVSDLASSADAVSTATVLLAMEVDDLGQGTEEPGEILAAVAIADEGVAADIPSVSAAVPVGDTAASADLVAAALVAQEVSVTDAGAGVDAVEMSGTGPVGDYGAATERITVSKAGIVVLPTSCEIDSDLESLADSVQLALLEKDLAAPLAPAALNWRTITEGDTIRVRLGLRGLDLLDYGEFRVDESSLEAMGSQLATAIRGRDKAARLIEERARIQYGWGAYEDDSPELFMWPTARAVAKRICARVGFSVVWDAPNYQMPVFTLKAEHTLSKALGDLLEPLRKGKRYRTDAWIEGDQVVVRRRGSGPTKGTIDCATAPRLSINRTRQPLVGEITVSGQVQEAPEEPRTFVLETIAGGVVVNLEISEMTFSAETETEEGSSISESGSSEIDEYGLVTRRLVHDTRVGASGDAVHSRRETNYGYDSEGRMLLEDEVKSEDGKPRRRTVRRREPGPGTVRETVSELGYDYDGNEFPIECHPRSSESPGNMPDARRTKREGPFEIVVTPISGIITPLDITADGGGTIPVTITVDGTVDRPLLQQIADDLAAESGKWLYTVTLEWPRPFLYRKADKVALNNMPGGIGNVAEAIITGLHTQFDEKQAVWSHTVKLEWWADS